MTRKTLDMGLVKSKTISVRTLEETELGRRYKNCAISNGLKGEAQKERELLQILAQNAIMAEIICLTLREFVK